MELRDVGRIIWGRRWIVLSVLVATVGVAAAVAFTTPKRYESTATIAVTPDVSKGPASALRPADVESLMGTYAATAKSESTVRLAEAKLGYKLPGRLTSSAQLESGILRLSDRAASPGAAAAAASVASAAFVESLNGNGLVAAQIIAVPTVNATPVQPRPLLIIGVALFLGLAAGCMLALALHHFRQRVATADAVADVVDVPVLGHVPYKRSLARKRANLIVWESQQFWEVQEAIRALRTNLQLFSANAPQSILVTSTAAAQGKSTLVANLGIALSQAEIDTLIVDADMRTPRQAEIFGLDTSDGLSTLLQHWGMNARTPLVRPQATDYQRLKVLTAGPTIVESPELLYTRFRPLLATLLTRGSIVLIDSPPLLPVADARIMATEVDVTIMVVNARRERPAALRSAVEKINLADANLAGIVLNQTVATELTGYDLYGRGVKV